MHDSTNNTLSPSLIPSFLSSGRRLSRMPLIVPMTDGVSRCIVAVRRRLCRVAPVAHAHARHTEVSGKTGIDVRLDVRVLVRIGEIERRRRVLRHAPPAYTAHVGGDGRAVSILSRCAGNGEGRWR